MTKTYTYTAVGNTGFCVQSSLWFLTWVLIVRYNRLRLGSLGIRRRHLPGILKTLIRVRLSNHTGETVTLPVFGHLCLHVHRGFKVFNLRELSVTKVFDADVDSAEAAREIQAAGQASGLRFAPQLLDTAPDNRWYRETYIMGKRGSKSAVSKPEVVFRETVVDQLKAMIESRPLQTLDVNTCLAAVVDRLAPQLADSQLERNLQATTVEFIDATSAALKPAGALQVQLAFSHGDFSFVNFVYADKRIYVIDWEGAGSRSLLHDLYNFFFTELYYQRTAQPLMDTIDAAADLLLDRLTPGRVLPVNGLMQSVYRRLYYLERIEMLLCRDAGDARSRVLRRTLEMFNEYERISGAQQTNEDNHAHKIDTV